MTPTTAPGGVLEAPAAFEVSEGASEVSEDSAGSHPADSELSRRVEQTLAGYLAGKQAEADLLEPAFGAAARRLVGFVLDGGKRVRPTFAWWGWRGAGGDLDDGQASGVLRAVSALELLQACALVHDDLIDASTTRRGRPTMHVRFAAEHAAAGWLGGPERFGVAAALLLGDLALAWADDMVRASGLDARAAARAMPVWEAMRTEVLAGQYLDVLTQAVGDSSPEAALRVNRYKTAAYTVERPLHLGAAIAGASQKVVAAYRRFGTDVGVAFQLRDDLLGVFGDPSVTGKPAGDDLREGKRTLLVAFALQRAEQTGAVGATARLNAALGDVTLDDDRVADIRDLLVGLGAVQAVEHRIAALTGSALAALAQAPVIAPAAARLAELAVRTTRRST